MSAWQPLQLVGETELLFLLVFGANNKKIIAYVNPELPKIYLSS
jgi:hypothetical protein